jgi:hypothetical protein
VKDVITMVRECPSEVPDCHDQEACPFLPSLSKLEVLEVNGLQLLPMGRDLPADKLAPS